jgi:hypothetical protein
MPYYNVTMYPVMMVRYSAIEAETPEDAAYIAETMLEKGFFSCRDAEFIEYGRHSDDKPCVDLLTADGETDPENQDLLLREEGATAQCS